MEDELRQNAINAASEAMRMWGTMLRSLENRDDWWDLMDTARTQRDEVTADFEEALQELRAYGNSTRKSAANREAAA